MKTQYPLLRPAIWLHKGQSERLARHDRGLDSALDNVLYHAELLIQHAQACRNARGRGWHAAAIQLDNRIVDDLHRLQYATTEAQNQVRRPTVLPQPKLRDLYEELTQLQQEFVKVTIDPKHHLLAVVTDSIELEGVYLGEFRLELHLDRLRERADVSAFEVVALDPNPPDSSQDVTHPHVRDNQLCAGEATGPIAQALKDGRFCDAFLAVSSVLHEYNPHSPYVNLENWQGVACADCGSLTNEDERYYCEECDRDYCEDCYSTCDICESSFCRGCLEEDKQSGKYCCRSCRQNCQRCGRIVDADSFDEATNLCPECLEERQRSEKPLQTEEIKHEQHEQTKTNDSSPEACTVPEPV
jgi:hypothetical protein